MHFGNAIINSAKNIRNALSGKSFRSISSFVNVKNILLNLVPGKRKLNIHCILCGIPRSGSHWIQNVIEKSAGIKTFDIYKKIPTSADEEINLIKIHARNKFIANTKARLILPPFKFNNKYIYTYRDPRDVIISLYEMYKVLKKQPNLKENEFLRFYDPIGQYRWEIEKWVIPQHNDVLLVRFEDLKLSPINEFQKIFEYLGLRAQINKETINEIKAATDTKRRPRGALYGWKKTYHQYKELISNINRKLEREIILLNYDLE